jgi:shikimate kinase
MGSGKTTVGRQLARELGVEFVDLDDEIERAEGMTITELFDRKGEVYFRKAEARELGKLLEISAGEKVLATGGGTPCYGNNLKEMKGSTGRTFYLKYSPLELARRLSQEKELRPLVRDVDGEELVEYVAKHLFERQAYYIQANHTIQAGQRSIRELTEEIRRLGKDH